MAGPPFVALGAACVVVDDRGWVLMVRHTYGHRNWELPGGGSVPGEDPATTAQRELLEETGVDAVPAAMTGLYFESGNGPVPMLHVVFRLELPADQRPVASSPEVDAAAFWPADALPRPLSDFTARRIADALGRDARWAVIRERRWLEPEP
jgi:8-oxo-dGTP diphosphatase